MNKGIILTPEFLHAKDVMPVVGDPTDYISPSVFDIPNEVDVLASNSGDVVLRFVYPDREEASDEESLLGDDPDILVKRGRHSGKVMSLRVRKATNAVPAAAERLKVVAPFQKRKNQELNFLLVSNILRKKQDELQLA